MAVATSSLPTPLSPVTRTFASDLAIRSISCDSSRIAALLPINSALPCALIRRSPGGLCSFLHPLQELLEILAASVLHRAEHGAETDMPRPRRFQVVPFHRDFRDEGLLVEPD